MHVSRDQRIALGELKNLAGFVMDREVTAERYWLVCALALRMKEVITGGRPPYLATDTDIVAMLATAAAVEIEGDVLMQEKPN